MSRFYGASSFNQDISGWRAQGHEHGVHVQPCLVVRPYWQMRGRRHPVVGDVSGTQCASTSAALPQPAALVCGGTPTTAPSERRRGLAPVASLEATTPHLDVGHPGVTDMSYLFCADSNWASYGCHTAAASFNDEIGGHVQPHDDGYSFTKPRH